MLVCGLGLNELRIAAKVRVVVELLTWGLRLTGDPDPGTAVLTSAEVLFIKVLNRRACSFCTIWALFEDNQWTMVCGSVTDMTLFGWRL